VFGETRHGLLPLLSAALGLGVAVSLFLTLDPGAVSAGVLSSGTTGVGVEWVVLAAVAFPMALFTLLLGVRLVR
jgi:hypothetical protein